MQNVAGMAEPLDLREAHLRAGFFAGADLTDADLRRADLTLADLTGAAVRGARLNWADLTCARLADADLRNADLSGADLSGADLRGADLRGALLDGAQLAHARVAGARGLPIDLVIRDEVVCGPNLGERAGEPTAAMTAFRRGQTLHAEGRLAHAGRAYALARAWQPDSDIVPYALACLALDADDPDLAALWLEETLRVDAEADRARLELTLLHLTTSQPNALKPVLVARWPQLAVAPIPALRSLVGETALTAWLDRRAATHRVPEAVEPTGHAVVARAVADGDLTAANAQLRRLEQQEPLAALWRLLLPKLQVTAEAFTALLQTRSPPLGPLNALTWQSLGAHATTARLEIPQGVVWAQRAVGRLRSAESLSYTAQILSGLRDHGFQVPELLTDTAAETRVAFDEDWLVASADLPGTRMQPTLDACLRAGQLLAKIHNAAPLLNLVQRRPPGGLRSGVDLLEARRPGEAWQAALATEPTLAAHLAPDASHSHIPPLLELTARRLRDLLPLCPRGLCHGDFAPHNLLEQPDGAIAVLDWDLADAAPLVWDLARALDLFAVRWPMSAAEPLDLHRPRLRAFLRGYTSERPLNTAEVSALPVLLAVSRLDLDTTLLTFLAPLDPSVISAVLPRLHARVSHAAAGAPDLAEALWPHLAFTQERAPSRLSAER